MTRAIFYIVSVGVLVGAAAWVADQPGGVSIEWLGYRIQTEKVGVLIGLVAIISVIVALLYRLWLGLRRAPQGISARGQLSRQHKGYKALTQGMVAVAAGDATEARRQAKRADQLLADPPLTMLLSAQAAQLSGDEDAARNYFTAMLDDPETAFLGLRGLLMQAQRDGDKQAALGYAESAHGLRPKTPWVLTTLFDLQAEKEDWVRALATLEDAIRLKAVDAVEGRRRKLAVLLGCAKAAEKAGSRQQALSYARKAYALSTDFLPAVLAVVRLLISAGKNRAAARIIQNAWERQPHRELARLFAGMGTGEGAINRVRRLERLVGHNPNHSESHIVLAEAAIAADLWGVARNHLEKAIHDMGESATARVYRLMAELEESERHDGAAARSWLLRAASADPDPAWVCTECGSAWEIWSPLCGKCHALATQSWQSPPRAHRLMLRTPDGAGAGSELGTEDGGAPGEAAAEKPAASPAALTPSLLATGTTTGTTAAPNKPPTAAPGALPAPPDVAGARPKPAGPPDTPGDRPREAARPTEPGNPPGNPLGNPPDAPKPRVDQADKTDRPGPPPLTRITGGAN